MRISDWSSDVCSSDLKALRSMETGLTGLNEMVIPNADDPDGKEAIVAALAKPTPDRLLVIAQAFRHGLSVAEVHAACKYDPWFLEQIAELVAIEAAVRKDGLPRSEEHTSELQSLMRISYAVFCLK